jgi:hypothetical protein
VGAATDDTTLDSDGDGQSNYAEFLAGTDPQISAASGEPVITIPWAAITGRYYRVWSSNDLVNRTPVTQLLVTSDGTRTVHIPTGGAACFARVVLDQ